MSNTEGAPSVGGSVPNLKLVTFVPQELQERIDRGYDLHLHTQYYKNSGRRIYWLHDTRDRNILLLHQYLVPELPPVAAESRVLMPSGIWVRVMTKGPPVKDMLMFERNMGLKPKTLINLWQKGRGSFRINVAVAPKPPPLLGHQWNQWTDLPYHDPDYDYRAHLKMVKADAPDYMHEAIWDFIRAQRYAARVERAKFDWERAYPEAVYQINQILAALATSHDCMDNVRVAKVGVRSHYQHYVRQQRRGCCGSYDQVHTLGVGQFHIGFNYGH